MVLYYNFCDVHQALHVPRRWKLAFVSTFDRFKPGPESFDE